jgi:hypothetical protein
MLDDVEFEKSDHRDAEARAWFEVAKVALSAYLLGVLSCVWLMWMMGVFSR